MQLVSVTEEDALDRVRWRQLICVANGAAEGMRRHYLLFQKHQILHIQNPNVVGGGVVVKCLKRNIAVVRPLLFSKILVTKEALTSRPRSFSKHCINACLKVTRTSTKVAIYDLFSYSQCEDKHLFAHVKYTRNKNTCIWFCALSSNKHFKCFNRSSSGWL